MPVPHAIERHLTGEFKHGTVGACCNAPCACLLYCFAPNCMVCIQRKRLLRLTGEQYVRLYNYPHNLSFRFVAPEFGLVVGSSHQSRNVVYYVRSHSVVLLLSVVIVS